MTLVSTTTGLWFPRPLFEYQGTVATTMRTIAAANVGLALIGNVYIDGRPSSPKTISSAGGKIHWRPGAVTFANGSTTLDIGIQDVDVATGQPVRPDGTFDVKKTLTGGTDTISANAINSTAMATGSKSIAQGDLIAVEWLMTARGGADSVVVSGYTNSNTVIQRPSDVLIGAGPTYTATISDQATAVIEFDDGTLGSFFAHPMQSGLWVDNAAETFSDSTNPDERGVIFQVPWQCKIDALGLRMITANATTSDSTLTLYSTPLGTPSSMVSKTIPAESLQNTSSGVVVIGLASEITLSPNTDYCLALRATGTTTVSIGQNTLGLQTWRTFFLGGVNTRKGTRDGGSGAFSEESPAVTHYTMAVRISAFNATGTTGGGIKIAGLGGLAG